MPAAKLVGEHNVAFVHIPKTAGTSIGRWMDAHKGNSVYTEWYEHPLLSDINKDSPSDFTFTVVRNPWERIISFYHFLSNMQSASPAYTPDQLQSFINKANKHHDWSTFDKWLDIAHNFSLFPGWWFHPVTPQTAWTSNVNLVLKYESLEEDFKQIQSKFNNWDPLPKLLVTDYNNYQTYYNTTTKEKVRKMFEEEIDLWEYTF